MTRTELFNLYEVFVNTDTIPVEAISAAINEYASENQLRFADLLSSLHLELLGPDPYDIDFDHPPYPDEARFISPPVDFGDIQF